MRYLLVEDNLALAKAVLDRLSLDGHVVDHAVTLETAQDYLSTADYDLILLDIMLPDGDARTLLKSYRMAGGKTPIITITARSEVSDRVGVLDLGADDYITKPFDFSELEARCRAVIRRQGGMANNIKRFGNTQFDPLAGTLTVASQRVQLRNRELRLLEIFINSKDQLFSKSKLVDRLFSYEDDVAENAIEVYVGRLRKQLEGSDLNIVTVRGMGYRLSVS
ncbi:MAG: response regulator transcription factor [Marinovum sp.]|nr:response regulator transcription factor [Marinovum sp.]MBT6096815.1 response regulator transcription factor [Marinovum sp.]MBT6532712.1 response regulator transcription factor [Marinovum sp.]MBT7907969.1 response regulator transcription factor [Marinovum sp.]